MPRRVDEQALLEPERIAKHHRNMCTLVGTEYRSPGVCCDESGSVPKAPSLMPVPTDGERAASGTFNDRAPALRLNLEGLLLPRGDVRDSASGSVRECLPPRS